MSNVSVVEFQSDLQHPVYNSGIRHLMVFALSGLTLTNDFQISSVESPRKLYGSEPSEAGGGLILGTLFMMLSEGILAESQSKTETLRPNMLLLYVLVGFIKVLRTLRFLCAIHKVPTTSHQ